MDKVGWFNRSGVHIKGIAGRPETTLHPNVDIFTPRGPFRGHVDSDLTKLETSKIKTPSSDHDRWKLYPSMYCTC